jgi:hypothetical protein
MRTSILVILAACGGGLRPMEDGNSVAGETDGGADTDPGGGDTDPSGDADTDADADTDTDTDTDTDADADTAGSPCTFVIPADAEVVATDTSRRDAGAVLWVCRNQTLSYAGDGGVVFLEQGAEAVISGTGATVYAVRGTDIHDFGDQNRFVVGDPGDVVDESETGSVVQECPGLAFDYGSAPSGC